MADRRRDSPGGMRVVAYSVGAALAALALWLLGRRRRRPLEHVSTPPPTQPLRPVPIQTSSRPIPLASEPESSQPTYEAGDANVRTLTFIGIGLLIALSVIVVATILLFVVWTGTTPQLQLPPPGVAISASPPTPLPPPPRLETQPGQVSEPYFASQQLVLTTYAWVDRTEGTVRIPIDRAMDLVAESGLPARPSALSQGYVDDGLHIPSGSSSGRATEELRH